MSEATQKAKLFNVRYLPLFAIFLILGIFTVNVSLLAAALLWVAAIAFSLALFFTGNLKRGVAAILILVMFLGFGVARLNLYLRNEVGLSGNLSLTCRVTDVSETEDGYAVLADEIRLEGSYYGGGLRFETEDALAPGDRVTLCGDVEIKKVSLDSFYDALQYRKGAKYGVENAEIFSVKAGKAPLAVRVKEKARAVLMETQGERAGAFSYATLFGDAEYMEEEDRASMRDVGVAHVFAISGLHISVLSAVLLFLFRKLKIKDGVSLLLLLPIFGFYAYLVDFTPSVLRAATMVLLSLAASHFGMRYDDLSALSFAAIALLFARPLLLFDVAFLMSFLSVFGIHSLASPLKARLLPLVKSPRLAGALSLSAAATLSLFPISSIVFGKVSFVGFFLNVLVVPMASVSYVLSLFGLLLTVLIPSFGVVLRTVNFLPLSITELSSRAAALGLSVTYAFSTAGTALYYAVFAFLGKYSLAPKKAKLLAGGMGAGALALIILAV